MAHARNGKKEHGSIEVYFTKKLANNNKVIRDRAVKRLKTWLSSRPGDSMDHLDIMKLWKGLFYSMWFSDKPLVQEDLANMLAKLIHSLKDLKAVCKFIDAFILTIGREWHGIDSLRLDKFYMLIRRVLREVFVYAQGKKWDEDTVNELSKALFNGPCNVKAKSFPNGVIIFITEIFMGELSKQINESKPTRDTLTKLFEPFVTIFAEIDCNLVSKCIHEEIFNRLLQQQKENLGSAVIEVDVEKFSSRTFEEGTKETIKTPKRKKLFNLSKLFKEAAIRRATEDLEAEEKESTINDNLEAAGQESENAENLEAAEKEGKNEKKRPMKKAKKRRSEKNNLAIKGKRKKKDINDDKNLGGEELKCQNKTEGDGANTDQNRTECDNFSKNELKAEGTIESKEANLSFLNIWPKGDDKDKGINEGNDLSWGITEGNDLSLESEGVEVMKRCKMKQRKKKMARMRKKCKLLGLFDGNAVGQMRKATPEKRGSVNQSVTPKERNKEKKVIFELHKNSVKSIANLKINPATVFTPEQKPPKGVLKRQTPYKGFFGSN